MSESDWCTTCCSLHSVQTLCPGELDATGPERHGWRVNAETPRGLEAYGVLVAPCWELWRARILTYPNVLWLVPGGRQSMKFVGKTAEEAQHKAREFVREHCRDRGYMLRSDVELVGPLIAERRRAASRVAAARVQPAPRKVRFLPVRFGLVAPSEPGGTGNLSETGMFIITETPMESGTSLVINLKTDEESLKMAGRVRWMRKQHRLGGTPGMGVQLVAPPTQYLDYVRRLA